jgi:hypothetical protein
MRVKVNQCINMTLDRVIRILRKQVYLYGIRKKRRLGE